METHPDPKTAIIKSLAIVGFFATVGLVIWLIVQGLRVAPGSFASLASIMETINSYRPQKEFIVTSEKSIVNTNESFTLSWTPRDDIASYEFSYDCVDGALVHARSYDGTINAILCEKPFSISSNELELSIATQGQRFTEVPLVVSYTSGTDEDRTDAETRVTVVNATVPAYTGSAIANIDTVDQTTPTDRETVGAPVTDAELEPKPSEPKPKAPPPSVTPPSPAPETLNRTISYIPISYPNGFTDLKIRFVGIGSYTANTFVPVGSYDNDVRGALRFEVKNIGTKTSGAWTFTLELPNGTSYTSETQEVLKPNERAEFTIGFEFEPDFKSTAAAIRGKVETKEDTDAKNNTFTWSAQVTD